jgi:hypothetical protein
MVMSAVRALAHSRDPLADPPCACREVAIASLRKRASRAITGLRIQEGLSPFRHIGLRLLTGTAVAGRF